jgi:putative ABC transport system substrate-binding protein
MALKDGVEQPVRDQATGNLMFKKDAFTMISSFLSISLSLFFLSGQPLCQEIPTILIVQSYAKGQGCGGRLEVGLIQELKTLGYEEGKNINIRHFYMDTQTKYMSPEQQKMRGALAIEKARELKPTVLVVFDDTAFRFVALPLAQTSQQIVYGGVNVAPERYNAETEFMKSREKPGYNITGITEESTSDYATQMMKEIIPSAQGMAIIGSNMAPFLRQITEDTIADIKKNPQNYPIELKSTHFVKKFSDLKKLYLDLNGDNSIDVIHNHDITGLLDDNGRGVKHEKIVQWILQNSKKPTFVWMVDWVPMGFLGGVGINLHLCGRQVAAKVVRVLNGEKAADIPIEKPRYRTIDLNLARAQQLGIHIPSSLLLVSDNLYTEMTLFPEYKYVKK